jgi:hypothetical protein
VKIGYIADADDTFATVRRNRNGRGRGLKITLEDIQLMPMSPLLQPKFEIEILTRMYQISFQGVPRYRSLQVLRRHATLRGRKRYWLSTLPAQRSGLRWK